MRSFLIATLMLSSISAFAADSESEFFWQAGAGQVYLTPELSYTSTSYDLDGGGDYDRKTTDLSLEGEYGLNENIALGATLTFGKESTDVDGGTFDANGLGDIDFYMKGSQAVSSGALKYLVGLSLSPGDKEVDANGDENYYSGENSLQLGFGYETTIDAYTVGAAAQYGFGLGDQVTDDNGTEIKTSGGEALGLTAFIETAHAAGKIGGALTHGMISDSEDEDGEKTSNSSVTMLNVYGNYNLDDGKSLMGGIGYSMYGSSDGVDDGSGITLNFGARFAL